MNANTFFSRSIISEAICGSATGVVSLKSLNDDLFECMNFDCPKEDFG